MRTCQIEGCEKPHDSHGYCAMHESRVRRHGDPLRPDMRYITDDPFNRFWAKVNKTDSCWLWTGAISAGGYGRFWPGGERHSPTAPAHRWLYEATRGPVPAVLDLDHLCRVRHCVNPSHLEPVTRSENLRRGARARKNQGAVK